LLVWWQLIDMHTPPWKLVSCVAALLWPIVGVAQEYNPVVREPRATSVSAPASANVIVKLRTEGRGGTLSKRSRDVQTAGVAARTGLKLALRREISDSMIASTVDLTDTTEAAALERLRADPAVEFASPDRIRYAHATPSDPGFAGQWYLRAAEVSAVNATVAWDSELGRAGIVVAVLDTGVIYDHPDLGRGDLGGRLLPGFDFVSSTLRGNDGDGRDADPSDPGDWLNDADKTDPTFTNCEVTGSSWHGTRVAGMIGALTNNAVGVSGLSWNSFILPVRVLGKCGGTDSDILAGMRWAAGLTTPGATPNPTPARVLNLSLGSTSVCEQSYRAVIDELRARKVLVVISAGNEGTVVSSPANCPGVASVAALRHAGSKVGFSNLGPEVAIGAPGGNCVNINGGPCLFSLDTTSNAGTQAVGAHIYTDQINSNLGTSFSAPIVSGIAALMLSRNANLSTDQLLARLREGARPFPTAIADDPTIQACHVPVNTQDVQLAQCLCTTTTCGAGMVNAANSVEAADRPVAAVLLPATVSAGQTVSLDASGSAAACGRTVSTHAWTVIAPVSNPPAISGANGANASVAAPGSGSITLRLTVTDSLGRVDTADVVITSSSASTAAPPTAGSGPCAVPVTSGVTPGAPTPPPSSSSSSGGASSSSGSSSGGGGGGGGGALGWATAILLGGLAASTARRRRLFSHCN
jgi:serine protease